MHKEKEIIRFGGNGRRSSCISHGELVYISGITSVDLEGDVVAQTQDVLHQIDKLLALHESSKTQVLNVVVTLKSMKDYGAFNSVWDEWVIDDFEPCRSVTGAEMALPEYKVKISLVAAKL